MSAIETITMPKWGMTMTEGRIAAWLKSEGERVEPGDEFVEVETEKITNVVEAQTSGVLRRILVQPGQTAACGAPIALLADAEVSEAELDAVAAKAATEVVMDEGMTERKVAAGGMSLNVVSAGSGEGVPLILLHGFASDAASWMFVQEPLAKARTVHAIELPAHGGSDVSAEKADIASLADVLGEAIDALAPGPLHLAGHSLGGRLALKLAAKLGDRVRSLTLIAPAGMGSAVNPDFIGGYLTADKRRPMKEALRLLVADEDSVTPEMVERALAAKRIDGATEALSAIAAASLGEGAAEGAEEDRAAVDAPVLVIWGAEDRVIPKPADAGTVLPGVGHIPQMEAATRVAELIESHIEAAL